MLLSAMDQQGFELVGSIDMSVGSSGGENSSGTSERESSLGSYADDFPQSTLGSLRTKYKLWT